MMQRRLEPELMMDEDQALAYAQADFEGPNSQFVQLFGERFPEFVSGYVLDLGCGPGDITLRLARRYPQAVVHGLDGSPAMLAHAADALMAAPELYGRGEFIEDVLPSGRLPQQHYDAVLSNSLLHHLHDPAVLWQTVKDCGRPGAAGLIMDLYRPESEERAREIVETYSGGEPEVLKRDFYNSLLAAFTVDEVREQLHEAFLDRLRVETVSDRHLLVWGRL